jgi:hypothetical protein
MHHALMPDEYGHIVEKVGALQVSQQKQHGNFLENSKYEFD